MGFNKKLPYNKLSEKDKENIITVYYEKRKTCFKELSNLLNISERAISRILKEANINTKRLNRYRLNENFFSIIDTEEKAYILGLLYADGFIGDEHFNNIVLGLKDKELVEKVAKVIEYDGEIRKSKKGGFENSKESYVLNFSSRIMANDLRRLGLYPNKSLTLTKLPNIYDNLFRHFARGYFDGDGSIILSKHTSYHEVNKKIKKYEYPSYCFILLATGKFLTNIINKMEIEHYKITSTRTAEIKQLRINAKCEFYNLFNYLYGDSKIYLQRKYNKWLEIMSAFIK